MTYYQQIQHRVSNDSGSECWLWPRVRKDGYGEAIAIGHGNKVTKHPHQVAYELRFGGIPQGLVLDHLCRVRACWNPSHLEPVTNRENTLRGDTQASGWRRDITHCPHGHEYSPENTYYNKAANQGRGCRVCKACIRMRVKTR